MTALQTGIELEPMNSIGKALEDENIVCVVVLDQAGRMQILRYEGNESGYEVDFIGTEGDWARLGEISIQWIENIICFIDELQRRCVHTDRRIDCEPSSPLGMHELQSEVVLKPMNSACEVVKEENVMSVIVLDKSGRMRIFHYEERENGLHAEFAGSESDWARLGKISIQWVRNIVCYRKDNEECSYVIVPARGLLR